MAEPRLTFGEYLTQWMTEHKMTAIALARLTGEKSATSIARLKNDQCTPARCRIFLQQLNDAMNGLPAEEIVSFRRSIQVLSMGKAQFDAYMALNEIFLKNMGDEPLRTMLADELIRYAEADVCNVICMQCTDSVVADALTLLCRHAKGKLHIDHFATFPLLTSTAEFLSHVLPAMCDGRYTLTELRYDEEKPRLGLTAQSLMYVQSIRGHEEHYAFLLPCSDGTVLHLPSAQKIGYEMCRRLVQELPCRHIPINLTFRYDNAKDITHYLVTASSDFANKTTYMYCRDFHFSFIPIDVLHSAFTRNASPPQTLVHTITELRRLCYQFFLNLRDTKRPIRMFMSHNGIRHFMATGMQSNHFFALHVFTPEERIKVLENIIHMVRTNPNITIHFIKNEPNMRLYDFSLVEDTRLIITGAQTARIGSPRNPVAETYVEINMEDKTLLAQVKRFFEEYLMVRHSSSSEESIAFLKEQIARAKKVLKISD